MFDTWSVSEEFWTAKSCLIPLKLPLWRTKHHLNLILHSSHGLPIEFPFSGFFLKIHLYLIRFWTNFNNFKLNSKEISYHCQTKKPKLNEITSKLPLHSSLAPENHLSTCFTHNLNVAPKNLNLEIPTVVPYGLLTKKIVND